MTEPVQTIDTDELHAIKGGFLAGWNAAIDPVRLTSTGVPYTPTLAARGFGAGDRAGYHVSRYFRTLLDL
jgi:hypothetical protein